MATWDAGGFEISPADGDNPSAGAGKIREVKVEVGDRGNREHTWAGTTAADGIHRAGSAKVYFTTAAPTLQPDGATALGSGDKGRLYYKSSTGSLLMAHNGTTFVSTGLTLSTSQTIYGVKTFKSSPVFSAGIRFGGLPGLKMKLIDLGDWNLGTTASLTITSKITGAGVALKDLRQVWVTLRNDADTYTVPIYPGVEASYIYLSGGNTAYVYIWFNGTDYVMTRALTGTPSYTDWDATSFNRGWILVTYV